MRGEIQMAQGKLNDAVQTLQGVVSNDPGNAIAHYQLGNAFSQRSELDQAGKEWQEAVQLETFDGGSPAGAGRTGAAEGRHGRAGAGGDADHQPATRFLPMAMRYARFPLPSAGSSPPPSRMRARRSSLRHSLRPATWEWGTCARRKQNFPRPRAGTSSRSAVIPTRARPCGGLVNVYLLMKQPDKAIAAVNAQIALSPKNSGFYDLLGTVLLGRKDYGPAQTALTKVDRTQQEQRRRLLQALPGAVLQRRVWTRPLPPATTEYATIPKVAQLYIQVGSLYEAKHDLDKAKAAYKSALQIKRDDPMASNNLAYVLLETGGNADLALQLAQTARAGHAGIFQRCRHPGLGFLSERRLPSPPLTCSRQQSNLRPRTKSRTILSITTIWDWLMPRRTSRRWRGSIWNACSNWIRNTATPMMCGSSWRS